MRNGSNRLICTCAIVLLGSALASAQAPIIRQGVTEVGGFVGASYGIDQARVMGGGNVVYSLTKALMPFGEFSYFPGIGRTQPVSGLPNTTESFSIPISDFNFGFHLRIPIPKSRIIPYAVVSVGGIHSPSRDVTATYPDPFDKSKNVTTSPFRVASSTDFAFSGGGGIRYYATERMGFRAEFKAYKPSGTFSDPFYRVTGGFFFQF
jgi:hypothetical protein